MTSSWRYLILTACILLCLGSQIISAAEPRREGIWTVQSDEATGITHRTGELTLQPAAEPQPALKYRLIPDEFSLLDGNAAIFYLKALGWIDQDYAHQEMMKLKEEYRKKAKEQGTSDFPPYSWLDQLPAELPIEEVKKYLALHSFQVPYLKETVKRRRFDLDRNIHEEENPLNVLLPDIQQMRELARTQSLRFRVAVRENRIEDALSILGQQFALAHHLSHDTFLITDLVGVAIGTITCSDTFLLLDHPQCPNLYWALAALPKPLVNMRYALDYEHQYVLFQFKTLQEVDETLRPPGYWQEFMNRFLVEDLRIDFSDRAAKIAHSQELGELATVTFVATAYPSARQYLMEEQGWSAERIETYPTAQIVFLAAKLIYLQASDESLKWSYLSYWQVPRDARSREINKLEEYSRKYGAVASFATIFLPAIQQVTTAQERLQQRIGLLQTIEAIRMYGAEHNREFPPSLDELPYPAPVDPISGKPFTYVREGKNARLEAMPCANLQFHFDLQFAPEAK